MNAISEYSNKILFYEIKDTTSKDIFSLIPFRSKNLSIKKWNYTDEIIYCIIEGSKNSWINLHGYINSFENESNIKTEDWNDGVWGEFLKFLDTKLPDYEDIQKEYRFTEKKIEINTDTKALKNFHARTLEGYKTKMKNGETDKVLFDLEVLKSFEVLVKNGGKLPYFSERDYSISRKEYIILIKQNLKCSVPMALWIWAVYIITYTMTRRQML